MEEKLPRDGETPIGCPVFLGTRGPPRPPTLFSGCPWVQSQAAPGTSKLPSGRSGATHARTLSRAAGDAGRRALPWGCPLGSALGRLGRRHDVRAGDESRSPCSKGKRASVGFLSEEPRSGPPSARCWKTLSDAMVTPSLSFVEFTEARKPSPGAGSMPKPCGRTHRAGGCLLLGDGDRKEGILLYQECLQPPLKSCLLLQCTLFKGPDPRLGSEALEAHARRRRRPCLRVSASVAGTTREAAGWPGRGGSAFSRCP